MNPSLSFSLKQARTRTSVKLEERKAKHLQFLFEGNESPFEKRIAKYLDRLAIDLPWVNDYSFSIESENTFPHSTGIASSASAFGALALCLVDLDDQLAGLQRSEQKFLQTASRFARLGSGSASRSLYGGFVWWGKSAVMSGSTDSFAIPVSEQVHKSYFGLRDAVLLVDSKKKKVSSSAGHDLMNNHPFQKVRIQQANDTIAELIQLMQKPDARMQFIDLVEQEALSLHAMMMTSKPSFVLLKPGSLELIERIRDFRNQTQIPVGFTIDAGPNIHLLYWEEDKDAVHQFIELELLPFTENGQWLDDRVGEGPQRV